MLNSVGAVLAGAYAPEIFTANAISKRKAKIQKGMPDGLDLLVICAEAGLTVDAAFNRVARELGRIPDRTLGQARHVAVDAVEAVAESSLLTVFRTRLTFLPSARI